MLLNKAFTSGIDTVYVNAQVKAKGFYEKIGFKEIGHEFIEAGIVHIKMQIQENQVSTYCNRKH
jgi:predicted GNAT family N-acyltransferase